MLAGLALAVSLGVAATLSPLLGTQAPWEVRRADHARPGGKFEHPLLRESSGVVASRRQPGILWTLNDSGNDAAIFATDTLGRDHGAFAVAGAENWDWEAIAIGPCGPRDCLYIADTGDNGRTRPSVRIYRVTEPSVAATGSRPPRAEVLEVRYPNGPRDVEAAFVGTDGAVYLVAKGRGRSPRAYRIPAEAWESDQTVVAEDAGRLPISTGGLGNQVTDAALSPSGDLVAVRTYLAIYLFTLTRQGTLVPLGIACDAAGLQLQGEGISWLDDRVLVLTSEGGFGSPGTIVLLECGDARRDH
ncbi:MAG TPA: hypothetical protein VFR72_05605 [Gemmatimonadales bacterium]|nr:hypothetical protein [Gemmatimonadales bacterium]